MKRASLFVFALGMIAGVLALTTLAAMASTIAVCPSGCTYSTIQAGINAATAGDTVVVGAGTYVENVVIDKPLTLQGIRRKKVTIEPAVSNLNCNTGGGGSLCGGAASNIILVQADDVTIEGLTLDGDNPSLTSGITVGGADLDARNGIITNHLLAGVWNNLTVSHVTVRNDAVAQIRTSPGVSLLRQWVLVQKVTFEAISDLA